MTLYEFATPARQVAVNRRLKKMVADGEMYSAEFAEFVGVSRCHFIIHEVEHYEGVTITEATIMRLLKLWAGMPPYARWE